MTWITPGFPASKQRGWTIATGVLAALSGLVVLGAILLTAGMVILGVCRANGNDAVYDSDKSFTFFFNTSFYLFEFSLVWAPLLLLHAGILVVAFLRRRTLPGWSLGALGLGVGVVMFYVAGATSFWPMI